MNLFDRLFARKRLRSELANEIAEHLEARASELRAQGMSEKEAYRRARIDFGNPHLQAERSEEEWQWRWLESIFADVRLAVRKLSKSPGYAAIAILTLALGIGATTTIFTIIDVAMLRTLPVSQPAELVSFGGHSPMADAHRMEGIPMLLDAYLRDHARSFTGISAWNGTMVSVRDPEGAPRSVFAMLVSGNALPMMGVQPYLGRLIHPADDVAGGPEGGWPVVLNYDYWNSNFSGDRSIIGRKIDVSGQSGIIVGVMPRSFQGITVGMANKLFLPAHFASAIASSPEEDPYLHPESASGIAIGRLASGVTIEQANAELATGFTAVWHEMLPLPIRNAPIFKGATLVVRSASRGFSRLEVEYRPALLMLQGVVLVVLLLCCVNLGGLQLARVQRHQQEFAIRNALGAGRSRILRQCLTESLLLALVGSVLAAAIAWFAVPVFAAFLTPAGSGEASLIRPDGRVLLFTTILSVVTAILFGLVPAVRASDAAPAEVLKQQGTHRRTSAFRRNILISGQVALALVLVFAAGLFTQTLSRLRNNHTGFAPDHVLEVCAQFQSLHKTPTEIASIYHLMTAKLRSSPGVESASYTWVTPLTGFAPKIEVRSLAHPEDAHSIAFNEVGDGYFSTIGTTLLAGREFSPDDADRSVCIVNQSAARIFFNSANPVGEMLKADNNRPKWSAVCRVVGIVEDARYTSLRDPAPATLYFAAGAPALARGGFDNNLVFLIRSARDADSMAAYRGALADYGSGTGYMAFLPLSEQVDQSLGSERLISILSSCFAAVALLLSAIGVFGLLALRVQQRTQEIGVRMALGADRAKVVRMILSEAFWMIASGIVTGTVLAGVCGALIRRFLYGISPADPWIAAASIAVLLLTGLTAASIPALRAAQLNPMLAIRAE